MVQETLLTVHLDERTQAVMSRFRDKGMKVIHVETADKVYEYLISGEIQFAVVDMDEDYAKTIKLCYKMRNSHHGKDIHIIGLTAAMQKYEIHLVPANENERKWINCDEIIPKPINASALYLLIKKELAIKRGIDATALDSQ